MDKWTKLHMRILCSLVHLLLREEGTPREGAARYLVWLLLTWFPPCTNKRIRCILKTYFHLRDVTGSASCSPLNSSSGGFLMFNNTISFQNVMQLLLREAFKRLQDARGLPQGGFWAWRRILPRHEAGIGTKQRLRLVGTGSYGKCAYSLAAAALRCIASEVGIHGAGCTAQTPVIGGREEQF
jgi:hypothetical protein